jgi:hypothetical protein
VRNLFEKIAIETEEDFQTIIKKLESFGVKILRPNLPTNTFLDGKYLPPPMTPRDYTAMIGNKFFEGYSSNFFGYNRIKDKTWPECNNWEEFNLMPEWIKQECINIHKFGLDQISNTAYNDILEHIRNQGNSITFSDINSSALVCIGKDLYVGTHDYSDNLDLKKQEMDQQFPNYRNHVVNTGGHADGVYCPVCPGLIISLRDVPTYADTFPGWEVVYLPGQSWNKIQPFLDLKKKNKGKWWIPGFEHDDNVINVVETWLSNWTGYVEETVFDVNMLVIDPKNVMVFNYNKQVFDALDRYGITAHIVPFRHRYFWDGGIHCVTSDLHREGTLKDFFPERG